MIIISIIIPVFNAERYLEKCIKSIICQTYKNLEIIIVNDGSSDNSLSKCKKYAIKDTRIVIVNKNNNEGVEKARMEGLEKSTGQYIFFIDADDWLDNKSVLKNLFETAESTGADYVEIGCQRVLDNFKLIKSKYNSSNPINICQPELMESYFISFFGINKLSVNIWGKLYRKSAIDKANIKPLGLQMGEDLAFNLQLFPHLNKIVLLNQPGYNYRVGGMTSCYNPFFLKDMKKLFYFKEEMIKKYNYQKGVPFIRYELKNVLKTEICQNIAYRKSPKKEIIKWISNEIKDPIYNCLHDIDHSENFWSDSFVIPLIHKDSEELYNICKKILWKQKPKQYLKKIAFKMFNS